MRDLILLPLVPLGLVLQELEASLNEGVVVAAVVLEVALVQVDGLRAHGVEEILQETSPGKNFTYLKPTQISSQSSTEIFFNF